MKIEDSFNSMTTTNSSSTATLVKQNSQKLTRQTSSANSLQRRNNYLSKSRRQTLGLIGNDFHHQHAPSTSTTPLLNGAINEFFQATKVMEDEIMLPSRLKDMPADEIGMENSVQLNSWHELYTFIREMRNQLTRSRPFVDHEIDQQKSETKDFNEDEGILIGGLESNAHSSTSSVISSEELEQSSTSSNSPSFDSIRDELKHHYFGLIESLDSLSSMANRVTEKYREDATFKV